MPMEGLESPFHPQHPLLSCQVLLGKEPTCNTCKENIYGITFACFECGVSQHYSCAKYQIRNIKHNCHDHHLLHFGKSIFVKTSPQCNARGEDCSNTLFCCIKCKFYIHLECIPLAKVEPPEKIVEYLVPRRRKEGPQIQMIDEVPSPRRERSQIQETDEARDDEQGIDEATHDEQGSDEASDDEQEIDGASDDEQEIDEDSDEEEIDEEVV
ncbi:hypothetical protein PTKIN_Ptkin01aG0354700 [Pterospermum kingtungense]